MDINLIIVSVYSYLFGSIPFGLLLTKIFLKKDIRTVGSGNIENHYNDSGAPLITKHYAEKELQS